MTRAAHVIWDNLAPRGPVTLAPEQQLVLRCTHCGDRYVAALPASMRVVAAVCKAYTRDHQGCRSREERTAHRARRWRGLLLRVLDARRRQIGRAP